MCDGSVLVTAVDWAGGGAVPAHVQSMYATLTQRSAPTAEARTPNKVHHGGKDKTG